MIPGLSDAIGGSLERRYASDEARAAKSGNIRLSGYGGQAWGRAMFGLPSTGKTTTAPPNDKVFDKRVLKTLDDLSSSSEEEQKDVERTRVPLTSVPTTENRPKKVTKKRKRFSDSSSESDSGSDYEETTTTKRRNSGTRSKAKSGSSATKRKPPRKKHRVENKQEVREKQMESDTSTEKRAHEQDEESEYT